MGLTQDDVAIRAGVSRSTVQTIERGGQVSPKRLRLVLESMGLQMGGPADVESRVLQRLLAEGIPHEYAVRSARIIAAEQLPTPGQAPAIDRPA